MKNRKGITLVETVISMAAGSALMLLAISLVHQTLRFSTATRQLADDSRSLGRVALHFRNDLHSASRAVVNNEALDIEQTSDVKIQYRVVDHQIVREMKKLGQLTEYDVYRFGEETRVTLAFDDKAETGTLLVETSTGLDEPAWHLDIQINAVIGKWLDSHTASGDDQE